MGFVRVRRAILLVLNARALLFAKSKFIIQVKIQVCLTLERVVLTITRVGVNLVLNIFS